MSFKTFIYYCALCGGWGAFLAWAAIDMVMGMNPELVRQYRFEKGEMLTTGDAVGLTTAIAAGLGMFVAAAVGLVDAVLNATGMARLVRVMICGVLGLVGGAVGGLLGGGLFACLGLRVMMLIGWMFVGTLVGASVGVYDVIRGATSGDLGGAIK